MKSPSDGHTLGTPMWTYPVWGVNVEKVRKFALETEKDGYDWPGILGFLVRKNTQSQKRWFCSEWVLAALRQGGVPLLNRVDSWRVQPEHLTWSPLLADPEPASNAALADGRSQKC